MRMWMVNPKIMCKQHLLGEHVETHMFLGTLRKKSKINGYIDNNLFEPLSLMERHEELVREMERRGIQHKSELVIDNGLMDYLGKWIYWKIDRIAALNELLNRCSECRNNWEILEKT